MQEPCRDEKHLPAPAPQCVLPHRAWPDGCDRTATAQDGLVCCGWHRRQLDQLVHDIQQLDVELALIAEAGSAPKQATGRGARTKNPSPPAPANLDVLVLHDPRSHGDVDCEDDRLGQPVSVGWLAEVYCARVRDERPLSRIVLRSVRLDDGSVFDTPTTVPAQIATSSAARLDMLARHHDWIAAQDWLGEYVEEMTGLRKAMRTALRDSPITKSLGACYLLLTDDTACKGRLVQDNGSDVVRCTSCRARWVTAQELAMLNVSLTNRRTA